MGEAKDGKNNGAGHGGTPAAEGPLADYSRILDARRDHLVQVDQPLVLISQIGRSGGTLLMRLLDGHPLCHTVPHELRASIGAPERELLGGVDRAWAAISDPKIEHYFRKGFSQSKGRLSQDTEVYPMLTPPSFQRELFAACLEKRSDPSARDVLDCYMTSYFNAWLDNQNLYGKGKMWITAFEPGFLDSKARVDRLNKVYPDGRVLSMVRDPAGWYASARLWNSRRWGDPKAAMDEWCSAARGIIALKERLGSRLYVLTFEDLVANTKVTMRTIAGYLGIRFVAEMLVPTFNSLPIKANSSFKVKRRRMISEPLDRHRDVLDAEEAAYVNRRGRLLYEEACRLAEHSAAEPDSTESPVGAVS